MEAIKQQLIKEIEETANEEVLRYVLQFVRSLKRPFICKKNEEET